MDLSVGPTVIIGRQGKGGQEGDEVAPVQGHPPFAGPRAARPQPHHLAGGAELVEVRAAVAGDPGGQHVVLQHRGGQGQPLEATDGVDEGVQAPPALANAVPSGQEASQGDGVDGLHLAAQGGQRATPQQSQHLGVAPLPPGPVGAELAQHDPVGSGQAGQGLLHPLGGRAQAPAHVGGVEGPVGPGVAGHEAVEGMLGRLEEGGGQPGGHGHAQPVPQPAGVLGRGQALLAAHPHPHNPAPRHQLLHPPSDDPFSLFARTGGGRGVRGPVSGGRAGGQLLDGEGAEASEQVVGLVGVAGPAPVDQALQLQLQVGQGGRVDQLPQLVGAQQLAEQVAVERQGRGPALGQGGVALVHVDRHPAEQQRGGEGRGALAVDAHHPGPARTEVGQDRLQRGQVEHVGQALARGLQQQGERGVAGRHPQQVGRPLALLPQGGATARPAAGQQEGAGGVLPEAGGEQGGAGQRSQHQLLDLVGVDDDLVDGDAVLGLG